MHDIQQEKEMEGLKNRKNIILDNQEGTIGREHWSIFEWNMGMNHVKI